VQISHRRLTLVGEKDLQAAVEVVVAQADASTKQAKDPSAARYSPAGNSSSTHFAGPSDVVGALAFFTEAASLESAVTVAACRTMVLPREVGTSLEGQPVKDYVCVWQLEQLALYFGLLSRAVACHK
jgi:hypothetical protein